MKHAMTSAFVNLRPNAKERRSARAISRSCTSDGTRAPAAFQSSRASVFKLSTIFKHPVFLPYCPKIKVLTGTVKDGNTMWEIAEDLPKRMRELRKALDLTQDQFGQVVGRNGRQISNWETGAQRPHARNLVRWAKEHGWPLEIFQEGGRTPLELVNVPVTDSSSVGWVKGLPSPLEARGCVMVQDGVLLKSILQRLLVKAAEESCPPDVVDLINRAQRQLSLMDGTCIFHEEAP